MAEEKWIQKAVPKKDEGKFEEWCKNNGFEEGVSQSCIDEAVSKGGHAAQMANFAINVSKGEYNRSKKKESFTYNPFIKESFQGVPKINDLIGNFLNGEMTKNELRQILAQAPYNIKDSSELENVIKHFVSIKDNNFVIEKEDPETVLSFNFRGYRESKKKKKYDPNPWVICHTTVDKEKDPEKFERCVKEVKKQSFNFNDFRKKIAKK